MTLASSRSLLPHLWADKSPQPLTKPPPVRLTEENQLQGQHHPGKWTQRKEEIWKSLRGWLLYMSAGGVLLSDNCDLNFSKYFINISITSKGFEKLSLYMAQAGFKMVNLLPQTLVARDGTKKWSHSAFFFFFFHLERSNRNGYSEGT